jgi:hypothetical protein
MNSIILSEQVDNSGMIQIAGKQLKQTCQLQRVLLDVEGDGLVLNLWVAYLGHTIKEKVLREGAGVIGHGLHSGIMLTIFLVQVDGLVPKQGLFTCLQQLHNIATTPEYLDVLHKLLGKVLGIKHSQLSEDS